MKKPVHKTSGEASCETSRKSSLTIEVKEPAAGETVSDVPDTAAGAAAARESLAEPENQFEQRTAVSNLATKRDLEKFATKQDLWETKTELKQDLFDMERRLDEKLASKEALAGVEKRLDKKVEKLASKEALVEMEKRFDQKFATKQDLVGLEKRFDEKMDKLASKEALVEMEKRFDQKFATKQDLAEQEKRLVDKLASKEALAENKRDILSGVRWAAGVIIVVQIPLYIRLFFG